MRNGGDKFTLDRARQLRRNLTKPERLLWATLRRKQRSLRFRQQHPAGPYVLDFYCPSAKLCVEVDGSHHDQTVAADKRRDRWLAKHGVRVFASPPPMSSPIPTLWRTGSPSRPPPSANADTSPRKCWGRG